MPANSAALGHKINEYRDLEAADAEMKEAGAGRLGGERRGKRFLNSG